MGNDVTKPICGIVMPISEIDGCKESHWSDVQDILTEAIENAGFASNLVSHADDVGIIHKRIIQNLYDNPIVVCDVSGKNPNVMFELGLRLAFDKPTVIVKDERTSYSFDTAAIEHLEYPRDLRFSKIIEFKQKLTDKIKATHDKATTDKNYTTFLKHFGEFTVAKLDKKEVSSQEYLLDEIKTIRNTLRRLEFSNLNKARISDRIFNDSFLEKSGRLDICLDGIAKVKTRVLLKKAEMHPMLTDVRLRKISDKHEHLLARVLPGAESREIRRELLDEIDESNIPEMGFH